MSNCSLKFGAPLSVISASASAVVPIRNPGVSMRLSGSTTSVAPIASSARRPDRSRPDSGQPGPQRAGDGRARVRAHLAGPRRSRLRRVGRFGIQAVASSPRDVCLDERIPQQHRGHRIMTQQKPAIGFIGLGIMGKPMARNLLKAGYALTVLNRSRGPVDELVADGAKAGATPREVAAQGEVGAGQVTKACNQIVVGVTIEAVAEALALAESSGVDPVKVRAALLGGFAQSKI